MGEIRTSAAGSAAARPTAAPSPTRAPRATAARAAAAAALLAGTFALGGPAATATEGPAVARVTSFGFSLTPSTVEPGGSVVLSVTGCDAAFATASSGVFDSVSIPRGQTARVSVDRDARRGAQYSVTFTCAGENGSADLTIAGGTRTPTARSTAVARPTPTPSLLPLPQTTLPPRARPEAPATTATAAVPRTTATAAVPRATPSASLGVRGGLGGSVAGLDAAEVAAGAALVLAAMAGTVYAARRRSAAGRGDGP
ncbi:hypothetical protein [Streptomyces sp. NPDC012888]|uniref:hypothetical protein n=1 Tax=Streptomyces sp. NPDC012888 TaxID=3364855 RepID=UPI0036BCF1AE